MTTRTPADPASRIERGRQAQLAVVAAFVINGVLFASWAAHIPGIKADLGLSDATLGLALVGTPVGSLSAMALCSWLLPRVGSRPVVVGSLVGYALCGPLIGIAGSVAALFVALMLWGAFQGALDVAMNTQAIAVEHHQHRPLMNGFHAWWSVGAFIGAGTGAGAVALGVALTPQLLVLAAPVLVFGVLLTLRMLPDAKRDEQAPDPDQQRPGRRFSPAMLLLGAIALASMLCEGAAADWSSVYVRDSLDGGREAAGLAFTAFTLAMVIVRVFGDRLLARFALHRLLPALASAAAVAFAVGLAVGGVVLAVVAFSVLGLGLGTVVPTAFSAAGRLPGLHPGVAVAVVSSLGWVGFVCGPPLIGQLAAATSLPAALGVVPVLAVFIAVTSARVTALRNGPETTVSDT